MDKKLLMMALLITTGLATHAQEKLTRYQVRNGRRRWHTGRR